MSEEQRAKTASDSQKRMWKIMRGMGAFTKTDIVEIAGVSEKIAKNYMTLLKRTGCLRIDSKEATGRTKPYYKYRLVRNTGPKAPVTVLVLYDPNTGEYLLPASPSPQSPPLKGGEASLSPLPPGGGGSGRGGKL